MACPELQTMINLGSTNTKIINEIPIKEIIMEKFSEISNNICERYGFYSLKIIDINETINIEIAVDILKFDTTIYEYGKSENPTILDINKKTLNNLLQRIFLEYKIIDETMNVNISEDMDKFYTQRFL
jgi:hypothetical protein